MTYFLWFPGISWNFLEFPGIFLDLFLIWDLSISKYYPWHSYDSAYDSTFLLENSFSENFCSVDSIVKGIWTGPGQEILQVNTFSHWISFYGPFEGLASGVNFFDYFQKEQTAVFADKLKSTIFDKYDVITMTSSPNPKTHMEFFAPRHKCYHTTKFG